MKIMKEKKQDNELITIDDSKNYFLGITNGDKYPDSVSKVKGILMDLESKYPFFIFIYIDSSKDIEQMKILFPEGIEYFPVFGVINKGEIIDVYFGSGIEETKEFIEKYI